VPSALREEPVGRPARLAPRDAWVLTDRAQQLATGSASPGGWLTSVLCHVVTQNLLITFSVYRHKSHMFTPLDRRRLGVYSSGPG